KVILQHIEVEGYSIAYLESSHQNAKTLILIHGLNDEKDSWLMLAGALKGKYHLIIIDLLGCGESEMVEEFDYTLLAQADFLQKIIEKLMLEKEIDSFSLAGHSIGGLVVLLADKLPIDKLILIDTVGVHVKLTSMQKEAQKMGNIDELSFLNITSRKSLKALLPEVYYKVPYIPNFILDVMIEKKNSINTFEKRKFRAIVDDDMLHRDDLTETLKSISQETLIVWGKEDLGIDVASAYKMHELIKHSTLKIYDKCRHYPQLEKPKELAHDIIKFLE
ncbi:MAG TPA: alpha/beta hydrolase, partial [Epsilonproteobacteria bacterium]|nr:alpha/beta hydrolase [Campylobacterota bacterium]